MKNSTNEAKVSFRFTCLNKLQAFTLVREIIGSTYEAHENHNHYVGYVPLTECNLDLINDYFVRQRIEVDACDIFVSVSAESGTQVVDIPEIVNRMIKYIDCKLRCSFTAG